MSDFPLLKTGAVTQYPAERRVEFSTQVVRFLDGSEQRFRDSLALHRWVIRLESLDETELNALREFFRIQNGPAGVFRFTDPIDGTDYPACSLETSEMVDILSGEFKAGTTLILRENRT